MLYHRPAAATRSSGDSVTPGILDMEDGTVRLLIDGLFGGSSMHRHAERRSEGCRLRHAYTAINERRPGLHLASVSRPMPCNDRSQVTRRMPVWALTQAPGSPPFSWVLLSRREFPSWQALSHSAAGRGPVSRWTDVRENGRGHQVAKAGLWRSCKNPVQIFRAPHPKIKCKIRIICRRR